MQKDAKTIRQIPIESEGGGGGSAETAKPKLARDRFKNSLVTFAS